MSLQFDVFDDGSGTFFYRDGLYDVMLHAFDQVLENRAGARMSDRAYLTALNSLIQIAPDFVDVHGHLAIHWYEKGKSRKALDTALFALGIANRVIPEGFHGPIEWSIRDNRPYLRAMYVALLATIRLRRHQDAGAIIALLLARNPGDQQGVRYLQGSEALRCGDIEAARRIFLAEAHAYPPYHYELALSHMLHSEWVQAATALRRGFVANTYIAEALAGNPHPDRLKVWHESNMAEPALACGYLHMYGALWDRHLDCLAFTRWLHHHPVVMRERANMMACHDGFNIS